MALCGILALPMLGGWIAGCRNNSSPKSAANAQIAAREEIARKNLPKIRPVSLEERAGFLGNDRCVQCHSDQAMQVDSRHARTLSRVDPAKHAALFKSQAQFHDPTNGLMYRTAVKNGRCVVVADDGSRKHEAAAEWAFGSGDVGMTFVGATDAGPTELRLSYFGRADRWDFTPGQQVGSQVKTSLGQSLTKREQDECFRCHTTALVKENDKIVPEKSLFGVGCETCHGPGKAHVEAVSRGEKELHMPRLQDFREHVSLGLCGQCHRTPQTVDMNSPGMASQIPRMQGVAIAMSGCYKVGKVTCMSCHDVHQNADETPRMVYNQRCMGCHTVGKEGQKPCPPRPTGDCVSCHMPAQEVGMPTAPKFRTHWIKVWPGAVEGSN
jgi:hypothetical protein